MVLPDITDVLEETEQVSVVILSFAQIKMNVSMFVLVVRKPSHCDKFGESFYRKSSYL